MDGDETRWHNKSAVLGMYDRESRQLRAKVVPNVKRETLQNEILNHIEWGSSIYSDPGRRVRQPERQIHSRNSDSR